MHTARRVDACVEVLVTLRTLRGIVVIIPSPKRLAAFLSTIMALLAA
jgi:hypothetical protein